MLIGFFHFIVWILPFVIVGLSKKKTLENLLCYFLIINVGIQGFIPGLLMLFQGKMVAQYLGWAWSPFSTELSYALMCFGILGLLCHWKRSYDFWFATALSYGLFLLLTFFNHAHLIIKSRDHVYKGHISPLIYLDLLTPVTLAVLFWMYKKKKKSWFQ